MATKINGKTTLKSIKSFALRDFGVKLSNRQAKEIKSAVRDGVATWTASRYISTRGTDDVVRMECKGVQYMAYRTFYPRSEWNQLVEAGEFN